MQRTLVTYYSLGGTTAQVATEIAAALGSDIDRIEDVVERAGAFGYVRSSVEVLTRGVPTIRTKLNPADYELVVLGTPVWVGSMSSPMRSFLIENGHGLRNIACFCTMGGRGDQSTLEEMMAFCRASGAPAFSCAAADVAAGRHRQRLEEFVRQLELLRSDSRAAAA
jgi:flavodoxin